MRRAPAAILLVALTGLANEVPMRRDKPSYPTVPEKALQGVIRTNLDSPNPTPAQLARKQRSVAVVKGLKLPVLDSLPVVEDDAAIRPRTGIEISQRCLAVVICAVKGETNEGPLIEDLVKRFSARPYFSPAERAFIDDQAPTRQSLVDFAWRYECVHVLLWALGYVKTLQPPHEICAVGDEAGIIRREGPNLLAHARLRPTAELLDAADLYYRLHWAAIELRIKGKRSPAVDEGIVRERHRALNWLIRYLDQGWDEVTTDT